MPIDSSQGTVHTVKFRAVHTLSSPSIDKDQAGVTGRVYVWICRIEVIEDCCIVFPCLLRYRVERAGDVRRSCSAAPTYRQSTGVQKHGAPIYTSGNQRTQSGDAGKFKARSPSENDRKEILDLYAQKTRSPRI